jgi:hypothetical protein
MSTINLLQIYVSLVALTTSITNQLNLPTKIGFFFLIFKLITYVMAHINCHASL